MGLGCAGWSEDVSGLVPAGGQAFGKTGSIF